MSWWAPRTLASSCFGLCALFLAACNGDNGGGGGGAAPPPGQSNSLRLSQPLVPAGVLASPVFLTAPPNDFNRLFIVEQGGLIRILDVLSGAPLGTPFLDVRALVLSGGERGLLGMAFDPDYANNGRFYIHYTARSTGSIADGDIVIARYEAIPPTSNTASTAATILQTISHSANNNHNGGMLAFGPDDRCLYAGIGDGGGSGDPSNNGQTSTTLLGKILRLNPNDGSGCTNLTDNPFASGGGAAEVWSLGLRNPWRFSFDRETRDLYIGDVGQSCREEVDVVQAPNAGKNVNFGWRLAEGFALFDPNNPSNCPGSTTPPHTPPILDYTHDAGDGACSITGGYVYRGTSNAAVVGTYFYADFCAGFVRSFRLQNGQLGQQNSWPLLSPQEGQITSFGEDARGELYLMTQPGGLYRLVAN
jgi:glucose/arabinose dehydrogenase